MELRYGGSVKRLLADEQKYSVVQLTNLRSLPPIGLSVTIAPLKLKLGSGGPTRVFAEVHTKKKHNIKNVKPEVNILDKQELCKDYVYPLVKREEELELFHQRQQEAYSSATTYSTHSPKTTFFLIYTILFMLKLI